jgi:plasmid rolling circle replication initiator protein Rep
MPQSQSTQTEPICLSDLLPSELPWDVHGQERDQVQQLYKEAQHIYAPRLQRCSQLLSFALKQQPDAEDLKARLQNTKFCRVRNCPVCQWRRQLRWRAEFFKTMPRLLSDFPTYRFLFLTLTIRNCAIADLRTTITAMNKGWAKMSRECCRWWPAVGWLRSLEVTRSKDGTAHPHFHAILMVQPSYFSRGYINQAQWTDYWAKAMKLSYTPIVHVKTVKPKVVSLTSDDSLIDRDGIVIALCETLKYTVKPSDLVGDVDWLISLTEQLHKTRAIATGGLFKKYLKDLEKEETEQDLIAVGEEDIGETVEEFQAYWNKYITRYQIRN